MGAERPPSARDTVMGFTFWLCFALGVVLLTHPQWYDQWGRKDSLDLLIAAGTLALAVATAVSVSMTHSVIVQEDRRHREALAPLVRISLAPGKSGSKISDGLIAKNIGTGPALHVHVHAVFADGHQPLIGHISALAIGEGRDIKHNRADIPHQRSVYGAISVCYQNVFGDRYTTEYVDFTSLRFDYVPPPELRRR